MTIKLRTKRPDPLLKQIVAALKQYQAAHANADIEAYRHNSVSVRIRVINPGFRGQNRREREEQLWKLFGCLPEEVTAEISSLLLFTPHEAKKAFANAEFDDRIPSPV